MQVFFIVHPAGALDFQVEPLREDSLPLVKQRRG